MRRILGVESAVSSRIFAAVKALQPWIASKDGANIVVRGGDLGGEFVDLDLHRSELVDEAV